MELNFGSRLKNAWNAFQNKTPTSGNEYGSYGGSYYRPDRVRLSRGNERSIVTAIFNRIALDVAAISIRHCDLDDEDRFKSYRSSKLDNCLNLETNIDQTSRAFFQDAVMSMFDEGCVALVPVDTIGNPVFTKSYDIVTMRTGRILTWYPDKVTV